MKKLRNLFLLLSLCCCLGAWAQERGRGPRPQRTFNSEKFEQQKHTFIIEKAGLNSEETQRFLSIYNEMKKDQREVQREIFRIKRKGKEMKSKEAEKAVMKLIKLQRELDEIQADAYKKMLKHLPAKKVLRSITAEEQFHRQMIRNMPRK